MGIKITKNPIKAIGNFQKSFVSKLHKAHDESAQFMKERIDKSFKNEGDRGSGTKKWKPTTLSALVNRTTFPDGGSVDQQLQYLKSAKTLDDTGRLKDSNTVESELFDQGLLKETHSGTGEPYIETHENGGTITVEGKTFDVPVRSSHFITDSEEDEIEAILIKALS